MTVQRDALESTPAELLAELPPQFPATLRLRTRLEGQLAVHKSGDRDFDELFMLGGAHVEALAILDHESRKYLIELQRRIGPSGTWRNRGEHTYVKVADRKLIVRSARRLGDRAAETRAVCEKLIQKFSQPFELFDKALERLRDDPDPLVREVSVYAVLARYEGTDTARGVAQIGTSVKFHAHIRLHCAMVLGAEGFPIALELSHSRSERVRKNAAAVLGRLANVENIDLILDRATNDPLGPYVISGLAEADRAVAEPALLALIERSPGTIRRLAIDALAVAGTIRSVPALDAILRAEGREDRSLAKRAIDAIRSRLTGGEAGALAIASAPDDHGALSVPGSGAISVFEKG